MADALRTRSATSISAWTGAPMRKFAARLRYDRRRQEKERREDAGADHQETIHAHGCRSTNMRARRNKRGQSRAGCPLASAGP